jgi:ABC-type Mn2+/Zn2+ transport system ATPase subunit
MSHAPTPLLQASALAVGYGRSAVVSDIACSLERGAALAVVGANGSGKSTLLRTVAGLLRPVSGSLAVFGDAAGRFPARVAYLNQHHPGELALPLRAADVVRMARFASLGLFGRAGTRDEDLVRAAMDAMGIGDLANEPLASLSGGQKQRVFLAQVLAWDADLLLLDEPENNLDTKGRERFRDAARRARRRGAAAIIATHDVAEALLCEQAMLLARRVVACGPSRSVLTPETLLSTFGAVARLDKGEIVLVEQEHRHD